jgi:hypothetical protein
LDGDLLCVAHECKGIASEIEDLSYMASDIYNRIERYIGRMEHVKYTMHILNRTTDLLNTVAEYTEGDDGETGKYINKEAKEILRYICSPCMD